MKKLIISTFLILSAILGVVAQPSLTVGTITGISGNLVNVPVTINGCDENNGGIPLSAMQFYISYNNSVASYVGLANFYAGMPAGDWVYSGLNSTLAANWAEPTYSTTVSIPDGTVLFEIQFAPNNGGTGILAFIGDNLMFDLNYSQIMDASFVNGSITVDPAAPVSVWNGTGNWTTIANWSNGIPGGVTNTSIASGTVTLSIPAFAGTLTVEPNAALTITSSGVLNVSNLVLNSTASNDATGSFINSGSLQVSENTSVKRWLSSNEQHFISNPLRSTVELSSLLYPGNPGWIYNYSEPNSNWVNMYDLLSDVLVSYGYSINYTNDQTISFNSTNVDPFNVNATVAPTLTNNGSGWNLVGNPFPSALNWNGTGWTKTNIDNAIYFYNGTGYSSYVNGAGVNGGTQYIPSCQGYFVHANASGPKLTMPKSSVIHNTQQYYKADASLNNILRLTLNGNGFNDETMIRFDNASTGSFDSDFDAYKLMSMSTEVSQIYSNGDVEYAINCLPELTTGIEVPVSVKISGDGIYTIEATDLDTFSGNIAIYLEDTKDNKVINLTETPSYTFNAMAGTDNRFKVVFNTSAGIENPETEGFIYSSGKNIFIQNHQGDAEIYNLSGQLVTTGYISDNSLHTISLPGSPSGIYLVKVMNDNHIQIQKILVK